MTNGIAGGAELASRASVKNRSATCPTCAAASADSIHPSASVRPTFARRSRIIYWRFMTSMVGRPRPAGTGRSASPWLTIYSGESAMSELTRIKVRHASASPGL